MISFDVQKGRFIKHCPCTPDVVPCGYYNLNLHTGCPFDCSYCILQTYLEDRSPVFYTNLDDMEKELREAVSQFSHLRIGTGELSDSLAFDPATGYSAKIIEIFRQYPEILFEFKTKSVHVDGILSHGKPPANIITGWTLNPSETAEREERLAPPLHERLAAIRRVCEAGGRVAVHFDPMLIFPGWKKAYEELIAAIAAVSPASAIAWWSLGALRFPVSLREHIFKHPHSRLFEGELVKGRDGKYRYLKSLRLELFHFARRTIARYYSTETPLYLCMEDEEVWREILPHLKPEESEVNRYLWEYARRR